MTLLKLINLCNSFFSLVPSFPQVLSDFLCRQLLFLANRHRRGTSFFVAQQFRTLQAQVRGRAMSTAEVRLVEEDVLDDREEFEESWSSQEDEVDLIEEWIDNGSEGKTRRPSLNVDSILWSL